MRWHLLLVSPIQILLKTILVSIMGHFSFGANRVAASSTANVGGHRALHAEATAAASGSQSASASASASSVNGQEQATTASNATGAGATTYGQSAAAGQIDVCVNGPNQNYSSCRTFAPSVRSSQCTDVPPDDRYTCAQQVSYGKCDADFMFLDSYCLKSCNRCGSKFTLKVIEIK